MGTSVRRNPANGISAVIAQKSVSSYRGGLKECICVNDKRNQIGTKFQTMMFYR